MHWNYGSELSILLWSDYIFKFLNGFANIYQETNLHQKLASFKQKISVIYIQIYFDRLH